MKKLDGWLAPGWLAGCWLAGWPGWLRWLAARGIIWALLGPFGPWANSRGFIWALLDAFE